MRRLRDRPGPGHRRRGRSSSALALAVGGVLARARAPRTRSPSNVETTARLRSRDIAATVADGDFPRSCSRCRAATRTSCRSSTRSGDVVAASANLAGERADQPRCDPAPTGTRRARVTGLAEGDGPFRVVARRVAHRRRARTSSTWPAASSGVDRQHRQPRATAPGRAARSCSLLVGATTWVVTGRALRPVEAIRREVEVDRRRGPAPPRARARDRRRDRSPRPHDERDARPPRGRHRPPAPVRRRRQPRAAQPAHRHPRPARGRPRAPRARRLAGDRARACSTTRSGCSASSTTCSCSRVADASALDARPPRAGRPRRDRARREPAASRSRTTHRRRHVARCRARRSTATPTSSLRAVRNLLDNAARHATSTVTVALPESESAAVLSVADDGPGIPPDQRERIFERFTRLDDARTRDAGGTGLGLAITHDVVAPTVARSRSTATVVARGCASPCPCPSRRPGRRAHRPRARGLAARASRWRIRRRRGAAAPASSGGRRRGRGEQAAQPVVQARRTDLVARLGRGSALSLVRHVSSIGAGGESFEANL